MYDEKRLCESRVSDHGGHRRRVSDCDDVSEVEPAGDTIPCWGSIHVHNGYAKKSGKDIKKERVGRPTLSFFAYVIGYTPR